MFRAVVLMALLIVLAATSSLAQTAATGAVTGTIRDQTGSMVPEADVSIRIEEAFVPVAAGGQRPPSVGARWNYNQGPQSAPGAPAPPPAPRQNLDAPPGGAQPWLRRAMVINPALTAFVAAGLYDSLNSCAVNDVLVPALEPQFRRQTTARCYDGGHMMYDEPAVRVQVTRDVATFYQDTLRREP